MSRIDPRDDVRPFEKQWNEFRAAYAAARLHGWLLRELEELEPDYFQQLRDRVSDAIINGEGSRDAGDPDPGAPLQGPAGKGVWFWDLDEAYLLEEQLFPFRDSTRDFGAYARGLVLVGLHASLEVYCAALGITRPRTPLPLAIEGGLKARGRDLDAKNARLLIKLDETRHLYVHHRGVVTQRYVDSVSYNKFNVDEHCPVTNQDLEEFAWLAWSIASIIHDAYAPEPTA
jgi:hypothetical protein